MQKMLNGELVDLTPEEIAAHNAAITAQPAVPEEVTRRQGYLALFDAGVTEVMVEEKMAELLEGAVLERALLDRRTASTFRRDNPLVQMVGAAFGLDLNALFAAAAKLI